MSGISREQTAMLEEIGKRAVLAKYELQTISTDKKNEALCRVADGLIADTGKILAANEQDMQNGKEHGMHEGLLDRLQLTEARIAAMAEGLRQIAELNDPVGTVMERFTHPNGMEITQVRVPLGVIGIIYESRPNVTADAFGLCFKAGNAVILKGGSDAICSNTAITESIRRGLAGTGICADAVQLIADTDRAVTAQFMKMNRYVDVLIPRGGAGLIRAVVESASIPVIETGTGNCHIYVDQDADFNKAIPIIINAKTQRIGVCNACESLVIHEKIKDAFLPLLADALKKHHVEMRADRQAAEVIGDCVAATEEDFAKEYLDYIISIKTVSSAEEAIAHINRYHTEHSDAIITENQETARRFLSGVDSACVYVNASTRFTDGFEFGFGAEIGISTQKLHARGPMGLRELTSYKYQIVGNGQVRG
ncbi:MAG: glutamate-5-semialdehyde dehydrogenase [Clostridium sp.]|nr:glutamate-5-semialdehyde dehydrogenase [Clostridium sp.]